MQLPIERWERVRKRPRHANAANSPAGKAGKQLATMRRQQRASVSRLATQLQSRPPDGRKRREPATWARPTPLVSCPQA